MEAGGNISKEGKGIEEAKKCVASEKELNTQVLYVEVIMESFGRPEE